MKTNLSYFLFVLVFLLFVFFAWVFVFNIYEVKFHVSKHVEGGKINFEISPKTLNLLGFRVPFRNVEARYELPENFDNKIPVTKKGNICGITIEDERVLNELYVICSTKYNLFPEKIKLVLK